MEKDLIFKSRDKHRTDEGISGDRKTDNNVSGHVLMPSLESFSCCSFRGVYHLPTVSVDLLGERRQSGTVGLKRPVHLKNMQKGRLDCHHPGLRFYKKMIIKSLLNLNF